MQAFLFYFYVNFMLQARKVHEKYLPGGCEVSAYRAFVLNVVRVFMCPPGFPLGLQNACNFQYFVN
jgi:hypothetical protein